MAVFGVCWIFFTVTSLSRARLSQVVEYLCDEFGSKAAGVNAAITDLLRASRESLAQFNLQMYALQLAAEGKASSETDALRIYEESLGFGPTDSEETRKRIHEIIRQRRETQNGLSLTGLIDFMWRDPTSDSKVAEMRDQMRLAHQAMQRLPTIDWFDRTDWDGKSILRDDQIQDLVATLVANPTHLLVPLMEEIQAGHALTHPSHRNRIIYLWHHREAIMRPAAAPSPGFR
jgi:hypothetical protein